MFAKIICEQRGLKKQCCSIRGYCESFSQCQYRHIEESVDLLNAILTLKEKYRVVLLLYYYQEFTVKEIAEILDKKQSTVLSLMKRGREQLKQKLQTNYMEGERYEF